MEGFGITAVDACLLESPHPIAVVYYWMIILWRKIPVSLVKIQTGFDLMCFDITMAQKLES